MCSAQVCTQNMSDGVIKSAIETGKQWVFTQQNIDVGIIYLR